MKRIICVLAVLIGLILPAAASPDLNGGLGYFPYIYNSEGEPVATPAAYTSVKTITGETLGLGQLKDLSCIIYDNAGTVYIADSGNNRIVMLDNQYNLKGVIGPFDNNGTQDNFNNPTGLCAVDGKLYVADSANARILCFDGVSHQLIREFGRPVIETQAEDYVYEPTQLAVDYAGRMYVIAKGINQGLVQLDENGEFMSYMGAPKVSPTFTQIIRRWFATKEQAAALMKIVPTEYNAVKMDDKGFLYVTAKTQNVKPISRLNSQGENVLKYSKTAKMGYPSGDGDYADSTGAYLQTSFVDITVREDGSYLALDTLMGRVFAYDEGGSLLYVFGNMGALNGSFYSPSSRTAAGDDVLVTDRSKGSIDVFAPTDFGRCVNNAVGLQKEGYLPKAEEAWNQVLDQCSNYDIAYINLARIDIQNGNFSEAMEKLQATNEKYYYSQAFKEYRSEYISQRFTPIAILLVVLILVLIFVPRLVRRLAPVQRLSQTRVMREMRYGSYAMFHPFDGYWDIKREKRGSIASAAIFFVLFALIYMIRAQYSGYLFSSKPSDQVNVWFELARMMIPILLWCVSNWCFTTLMEGEGSLKDIFIATGFALKPYIYLSIPLFIMSHVLTSEEAVFYTVLNTISIIWVVALLFFGMMMTHDYSLGKALLTLLLTLVGICLILFISLLLVNLVQEVFAFGFNLYKEILFRFY